MAAPREQAADGGAMPWRRRAGEAGRGWPAGELLWGERVLFPGSIGAGEGRRCELDGSGTTGGHGGRWSAGDDARAELDSGRGRGGRGEEQFGS